MSRNEEEEKNAGRTETDTLSYWSQETLFITHTVTLKVDLLFNQYIPHICIFFIYIYQDKYRGLVTKASQEILYP